MDSPELSKADTFNLMPDPYKNRPEFDGWFNKLLSDINTPPAGYDDKRKADGTAYTKEELVDEYRGQIKENVSFWTTPYEHPKDPRRNRQPLKPEQLRENLRGATAELIKPTPRPVPAK